MLKTPASTEALSADEAPAAQPATAFDMTRVVTVRAFVLGLILSVGLAALNAWIENVANVHFLGGVQMPFGAVFSLAFLVLLINGPLKWMRLAMPKISRAAPPLSSAELLTIYMMMVFAALISTPGTENSVLTSGTALSYFTTRENGWAALFYSHIPSHFAPGWDGSTFQKEVIDPFYIGGLSIAQIPWHAWTAMLISWSIFTLLLYTFLFFGSLMLRKQWIENEALAFPLVQLPLQMVEGGRGDNAPPTGDFWLNRTMWAGTALAFAFHLLRGLNNYYPDWPAIPSFQGNVFKMEMTEVPWNSAGTTGAEYFFGAIGVAYLLTRELSFSFWVFFFLFKLQLVGATMMGFPAASLPKDTYLGRPTFITNQSVGGWMMIAVLLLWSARGHFQSLWNEARAPSRDGSGEPFSPRFIFIGMLLSVLGLGAWCWFAGINILAALAFFGLYALTSLVLARLVVEGGYLFPQATFAPLETLTGSLMSAPAMGAATLTKLSFVQPGLFSDMRANLLPGYLHALKVAFELRMSPRQTRRLMLCVLAAVVVSWGVLVFHQHRHALRSGRPEHLHLVFLWERRFGLPWHRHHDQQTAGRFGFQLDLDGSRGGAGLADDLCARALHLVPAAPVGLHRFERLSHRQIMALVFSGLGLQKFAAQVRRRRLGGRISPVHDRPHFGQRRRDGALAHLRLLRRIANSLLASVGKDEG